MNRGALKTAEVIRKVVDNTTDENSAATTSTSNLSDPPEDLIDLDEFFKDKTFGDLFRQPKNGSLLMKMKKGNMIGKNSSHEYEDIFGDVALIAQAPGIDTTFYVIGRMVLGHSNAAEFARQIADSKKKLNKSDDDMLNFLFKGEVKSWDDFGKFIRNVLPYHKDLIQNHKRLLSKFVGG